MKYDNKLYTPMPYWSLIDRWKRKLADFAAKPKSEGQGNPSALPKRKDSQADQ